MSWRILVPWIVTVLLSLAAFLATFHQHRMLKIPKWYLGYFAVAAATQLAFWFIWPRHYRLAFWICELVHNILLCGLSLEIIDHLLPRRYVKFWAVPALSILAVAFVTQLPSATADVFLNLSISASFTGGLLLTLLLFLPVNWVPEYRVVTAGVIAVLFGNILTSIALKHFIGQRLPEIHAALQLIAEVQLAPLVGLVLLGIAGPVKEKLRSAIVEFFPMKKSRT